MPEFFLKEVISLQHLLSMEFKIATNRATLKSYLQWTAVQIKPQFMWSTDSETSRALSTHSWRSTGHFGSRLREKMLDVPSAVSQPPAQVCAIAVVGEWEGGAWAAIVAGVTTAGRHGHKRPITGERM